MLEGKLLDADERKRLEAAVKRTRWSWTNTAEFFGIRMDQMSGVRHGKRPWPPRFTEYLEAVADAIEGVPVPAPQGQKEVEVGMQPVAPEVIEKALGNQWTSPVPARERTTDITGLIKEELLRVSDVAGALADIFMTADARGDEDVQAAVDEAVERLGIEPEVVEAIRERQQAVRERQLEEADPVWSTVARTPEDQMPEASPLRSRVPGALQQAALSQPSELSG